MKMKEKVAKKKNRRKKIGKEKDKLECAVDGAPSQIPTLKFLTHPAPQVPTLGHEPSNNSVQYLFYLLFVRTHTKFGTKKLRNDLVVKI